MQGLLDATAALARYDQMLRGLHNSGLFVTPLRGQEAVVSSRMEGTISTLDEVLLLEAEFGPGGDERALRELRRAHVAAAYGARQPLQLPRLLLQVQTQLLLAELQVMPRRRQLALSVLRAQIPKRRRNRGQKQQHRRQRRNGRQALLPQQALPPVSPRRLRRQKRIASHGRAV